MTVLSKSQVIQGVSTETTWWIKQRLKKFRELSHETMTINPFMAPLLVGIHAYASFDELAEFLLGGHFMVGHSTGFGKLVDEKILPNVFGTIKLDAKYRRKAPFNLSVYSEIDHIVHGNSLMSLKASRWTIQLTMAMQLNNSFNQLLKLRESGPDVKFSKIVVGVIYGTEDTLTDKFSIIKGICGRTHHDVVDIQNHVDVVAGRNLWTWLNHGEDATQDWVLDGILDGLTRSQGILQEGVKLLEDYKLAFTNQFARFINQDGAIDWHAILRVVNG